MERFLLDSSIILDILVGNRQGVEAAKVVSKGEACTSVVSYCEVLNKADLDKLANAELFLSKLLVFGVTLADGKTAKQLELECRKNGRQVPTLDCIIAATAANNGAIVVASDKDFERIEGVSKILF